MSRTSMASSPEVLKSEARAMRDANAVTGKTMTQAQALEAVARKHGYRDWNTASAVAQDVGQAPVTVGQHVTGTYLKQKFSARVLGTSILSAGRYYRVTLHFDTPVDVVTFDSFSALRRRVTTRVDAQGVSPERTSDGEPHVRLDLPVRRRGRKAR